MQTPFSQFREIKTNCKIAYRLADGFVVRVMPDAQVRVVQCILTGDTLGGVERQHLRKEVDSEGVRVRVEGSERNPGLDGQGADVVLGLGKAD